MDTFIHSDYWSVSVTKCLKGILSICILVHHLYQFTNAFVGTYIGHFLNLIGAWASVVFLFISGYGLFYSYIHKQDYMKYFFRHRFFTLYFSYILLVLMYIFVFPNNISVRDIVRSLSFGGTVVGFGWFFQTIFLLYIFFYLSFRWVSKKKVGFAIFLVISALFVFLISRNDYRYVLPFIFGMIVAYCRKEIDIILSRYSLLIQVLSIVGVAIFYMMYVNGVCYKYFHVPSKIYYIFLLLSDVSVITFAYVFCFTISSTRCKSILVNNINSFLGKISLEVYGVQAMVLIILARDYINPIEKPLAFATISTISIIILAIIFKVFSVILAGILKRIRDKLMKLYWNEFKRKKQY